MALSRDPEKRAAQLANLRRGGPPAPAGNRRAASHGAFAVITGEHLADAERAVFDALAADAPLRNADGSLPASDGVLVSLLAECLIRLDGIAGYLRDHGLIDPKTGQVRAVVEVEAKLRREAADHAEALGMSPRARAKIGMDLIRAEVAAQGVEADREARDRAARRFDAVDAEEDQR